MEYFEHLLGFADEKEQEIDQKAEDLHKKHGDQS